MFSSFFRGIIIVWKIININVAYEKTIIEEIGNAFFINFESIKFFDEKLNKTSIFVK